MFFYYILKFQIFKHQLFSLLIIGGCLIVIIITEFAFQDYSIFIPRGDFILALVFTFLLHFFNSLLDSIEKYLFEYDFLNPFQTLMWEGIFGSIITFIYYFTDNPLKDLYHFKNLKEEEGKEWQFPVLIILLILYIILCGGRNIFRVVTNKIYSPMAKTLTDYILNPFYLIYDYATGNDFLTKSKKKTILYFTLNLVLSFIISICGCVYNEFIVLFCCELDHETHYQLSKRAAIYSEAGSEGNSSEESSSSNHSQNDEVYQ